MAKEFGPFHRIHADASDNELVAASNELWGAARRNIYHSDIPKVKAKKGSLKPGSRGIEFFSSIAPVPGGVPEFPEWPQGHPGVRDVPDAEAAAKLGADRASKGPWVAIGIRITKRQDE